MCQQRLRFPVIELRRDSGVEPNPRDAQAFATTLHGGLGEANPLHGFDRNEIRTGDLTDERKPECALREHRRQELRARRFGEIAHTTPEVELEHRYSDSDRKTI